MARKMFVVAFFSICLMMAIPAGWADPGSTSDTIGKGDPGYVEEFTGETMEEVLNRFFNRTPVPPIPEGNAFTKGDVAPPVGDLTALNLGSTTDADLGQDLGVASIAVTAAPLVTPEPGTLMLLGSGILGLAILGRRKLNK